MKPIAKIGIVGAIAVGIVMAEAYYVHLIRSTTVYINEPEDTLTNAIPITLPLLLISFVLFVYDFFLIAKLVSDMLRNRQGKRTNS